MMKNLKRNVDGITLIALVITIIVLLILAGISINMLIGKNGIIRSAGQASETTKDVSEDEQVKLAVADALINGTGTLSADNLTKAFKNEFGTEKVTDTTFTGTGPWTFKGERKSYEISSNGKITTGGSSSEDGQEANDPEGYVGYYADLDGNPENGAEGIIYADLEKGSDGLKKWYDFDYAVFKYPSEEREDVTYKKYVLEEQQGSGFGEYKKEMIKVADNNGTERFYVMALEDINKGTSYTWYKSKEGSLPNDKKVEGTENDFVQGKTNTEYWIDKWNKDEDDGKDNNDIWKIVQDNGELTKYGKDWFVPSKSEWSAFGYMCCNKIGMSGDNYSSYGLGDAYWTSSMLSSYSAFCTVLINYARDGATIIGYSGPNDKAYLRLSTVF